MKEAIKYVGFVIVGLIIGLLLSNSGADMDEFEYYMDKINNGEIPYLNENTTAKQLSIYYRSHYPMSRTLVSGVLGDICD